MKLFKWILHPVCDEIDFWNFEIHVINCYESDNGNLLNRICAHMH